MDGNIGIINVVSLQYLSKENLKGLFLVKTEHLFLIIF